MSTHLDIHTPINEFIAEDVRRTGVFEDLNIDSCCGGHRTLAVACAEKGIDPEAVLRRLLSYVPEDDPAAAVVGGMDGSLSEAVDHLLETHHNYLKEALPRLAALLDKVVDAHVARHPELSTVRELFGTLRADLEPHLVKQEQTLFPMILQMKSSGETADSKIETLHSMIHDLRAEHKQALSLFERIRATTKNFRMPEDGCESYRLLLTGLDELELDTLLHFQKKNEILFPKTLAMSKNTV